jgi:hypothetical protein
VIQNVRNKLVLILLIIPAIFGVLALICNLFIFKSGVAGTCILIILARHFRYLNHRADVLTIPGAFIFSIAGDWCLSNRNGDPRMFFSGILLFFIAHAGYLSFSLLNGKINYCLTILTLIAYLAFFACKLYPSISNPILLFASLAYLLISCLSLGAAAGINGLSFFRWSYFLGIVLILFSDTIIALKEFQHINTLNFMILPAYYLAQILITTAVILRGWEANQKLRISRLCS